MDVKLLQSKGNSFIKKFIAAILVMTLTMVDFALLGVETISLATDAVSAGTATNNRNVTFDSYFKDNEGAIVPNKEVSIDSNDVKLFIQVAVKNEGYFNGSISLDKSNFKLKDEIKNNIINKIEENTITLNQINSGETIEFEVGISPIKEDVISNYVKRHINKWYI